MGNWERQQTMRKERDKVRRETLGKFFFDLAKLMFTTMVLGEMLLLAKDIGDINNWDMIMIKDLNGLTVLMLVVTILAAIFLAWLYTKPGKKWLDEL